MGKYRTYTPETKVRIVLEILRGEKSLAQASRDYQIKSSLLYRWKDQFLECGKQSFAFGQGAEQKRRADKIAESDCSLLDMNVAKAVFFLDVGGALPISTIALNCIKNPTPGLRNSLNFDRNPSDLHSKPSAKDPKTDFRNGRQK